MRLIAKYNGLDAIVVGYCPDDSVMPQAILVCQGALIYSRLDETELVQKMLPKQFRAKSKRLKRAVQAQNVNLVRTGN